MELKEMAKAFDLNVNEFSYLTKYSIQGLRVMQSPNRTKMAAMLKRLRDRSEMLYKKDMEELKKRQRQRQEVINYYASKLERKGGKE